MDPCRTVAIGFAQDRIYIVANQKVHHGPPVPHYSPPYETQQICAKVFDANTLKQECEIPISQHDKSLQKAHICAVTIQVLAVGVEAYLILKPEAHKGENTYVVYTLKPGEPDETTGFLKNLQELFHKTIKQWRTE